MALAEFKPTDEPLRPTGKSSPRSISGHRGVSRTYWCHARAYFLFFRLIGGFTGFDPFRSSHTAGPTSSPTLTFPTNWIKVPQLAYDYGSRQPDFQPSEPISFRAKDRPGINLRDALNKKFPDLNDGNDPMLQHTSSILCRFLVSPFLYWFSARRINWISFQVPWVPGWWQFLPGEVTTVTGVSGIDGSAEDPNDELEQRT